MDVDGVRRLDRHLVSAAAAVAEIYGVQPHWPNDWASRPRRSARVTARSCSTTPVLRVLGAPFRQVFVMKLHRMSAQDVDDMTRIWRLTGFKSAEEIYWAAYPHAPPDPHLINAIQAIATPETGR